MSEHEIHQIPLFLIRRGNNDRKQFALADLMTLRDSIKKEGLLTPPTFRCIDGNLEIVAGERRTRAYALIAQDYYNVARYLFILRALPDTMAQMLVASISVRIPGHVRWLLSDKQASAIMLLENMARVPLSPIAEAQAYETRLLDPLENEKMLAASIGVSEGHIKSRLQLLSLDQSIQPLVTGKTGGLPIGHALAMAKLSTRAQIMVLRLYTSNNKKARLLTHFSELCQQVWESENQMDMFAHVDESFWDNQLVLISEKIEPAKPELQLETCAPLPPISATSTDSLQSVASRYVETLRQNGHDKESNWLESVIEGLDKMNFAVIAKSVVSA